MSVMFNIPYGLYVVTTNHSKQNGCISNSMIQVTSNPNRISLALNKQNYTCEEIKSSGKFNVSFLDNTANFELIKRFGFASGRDVNKFDNFSDYELAENGIYYISKNTNAYLSCKVVQELDLGTHIMFIADVTKEVELKKSETLTYSYYHANIKPKQNLGGVKKVFYVCSVCGYVYEGETLPDDYICPLCKHDKSAFVKQETIDNKNNESSLENSKTKTLNDVQENKSKKYVCPVCGYESDTDDFNGKCPLCNAEMKIANK